MEEHTKPAGSNPGAVDAGVDAPVRYESGKGCLTLMLALLGLLTLTVLSIWLFGPTQGG